MPLTVSSAVRQLSDGNSVGTVLGTGPTDLIGFYGDTTPQAQLSDSTQLALTRGVAAGVLAVCATSQSPTGVANKTSTPSGLTLGVGTQAGTGATFQILSGDLLYVNKPTAQAGIGVGNVRVSATNIASVSFANYTSATITPTAGEKYGVVALRGLNTLTAVLTPAAVGINTTVEQQFTVTGVPAGQVMQVSKPTDQAGLDIVGVRSVSNNTVGVTYANLTGATITPTAGETYTFYPLVGVDAVQNMFLIQAHVATPTPTTATSVAEEAITVTGLATTDNIVGIQKPTVQAGLAVVGGRVSGANSLGVAYMNSGATVTPTANELYGVTVFRPNPAAPVIAYAPTLTPAAVGPNTTAEQAFTVTGVIAGSAVWVNKTIPQPGLGISGCRVSGTNSVAITFCNPTAATVTPTAGETYRIANFQQAIPDIGNSFVFTLTPQQIQASSLIAAIRSALAGTAFIAGA